MTFSDCRINDASLGQIHDVKYHLGNGQLVVNEGRFQPLNSGNRILINNATDGSNDAHLPVPLDNLDV